MKFDNKNFVIYESKEDSLIARDNYMFPFRIKKDSEKRIFESMSEDVAINIISMQQRIKENYDGKLNIYVIKANDLISFSDNQIINNKLYKKVKSFTEKDILSDSILVKFDGQ
jgi:hypothetical protein